MWGAGILVTLQAGAFLHLPIKYQQEYKKMEKNILKNILEHFEWAIEKVDFDNLPERDSEDYRNLLMQTANDEMFYDGRYNDNSEYTLELFDIPEYVEECRNLAAINALSDSERVRFSFFMDLKDLCYPLFRAKRIDWTAWPWNMQNGESSMDNKDLYKFIIGCKWPNLSAAIVYDIHQLMANDEENYTAVARTEITENFFYAVNSKWRRSEKDTNKLIAAIGECADNLWTTENHMKIGKLMGMDMLELSLYDAMDTFIDRMFRYQQVLMARELAAWIRENWTIGERHPEKEHLKALWAKVYELKEKYDVKSPNMRSTEYIIALDILGMSLFTEEQENYTDDYADFFDDWDDDELDDWDDDELNEESDEDKTE